MKWEFRAKTVAVGFKQMHSVAVHQFKTYESKFNLLNPHCGGVYKSQLFTLEASSFHVLISMISECY